MKDQSEKIEDLEVKTEEGMPDEAEEEPEESNYPVKKPGSRKKKKFGMREVLMIVIPAVAAVVAVIIASAFVQRASRQTTGQTGHQYYMDVSNEVKGGTVIKKSDDGTTFIESGEHEMQLTDLPIYYDDKTAFMITEDMVYYDPRGGEYLRADHFTEIFRNEYGEVTARFGGLTKNVNAGFLYNGKDMYIFLEPITLLVEDYTVELPALSYIEATYGEALVVFNYETKTSEVFGASREAEADTGDYKVQLFNDTMLLANGQRRLLFNAPDQLDPLISEEN